jgi:hypothetical protein
VLPPIGGRTDRLIDANGRAATTQAEARFPEGPAEAMTDPHFVDEKIRLSIRARIVELYDGHGLAAFRFPGVQKAIDLLLDAGEGIRVIQARHTEDEAGDGRPQCG